MNRIDAAKAVFQVINHYVDPGQVARIRDSLPEDVRNFWPVSGPHGQKFESAA